MTSPRSSTSSSSAATYVAFLLGGALVLLAAIAIVSSLGYARGKIAFDFYDLYRFQRAKVSAAPAIDTVFVGDSSLGNAIDAHLWSMRTGRPALNLGLTGAFGYGGSLNMLRHVLTHTRPGRVIVMQTLDMPTRGISYRGYLHTTDRLFPVGEVPFSVMAVAYLDITTAIAAARKMFFPEGPENLDPARDFMRQNAPLGTRAGFVRRYRALRFSPEAIDPSSVHYLRKIAELCRSEGLDCIYAHGPILDSYCDNSGDYLRAANALIETAGMRVQRGTPLCMPLDDVGDTEDHVRPERRAAYTEKYLGLIEGPAAMRKNGS